jgi:hypothetical protein
MTDERDNAGVVVAPPPLIYAGPLLLGLPLSTKVGVPFLPRGVARILGWPLLGGGVLLMGWFSRTMRHAPFHPPSTGDAARHAARCDRTRGTLPGGQLRRGVPALRGAGATPDLTKRGYPPQGGYPLIKRVTRYS